MGESIAEVAAIAAKLTEAQRAIMMETLEGVPRLYVAAPGHARVALFRKNLLMGRGNLALPPLHFVLTPLGIAVRNHLISQGADHDR